MTTRHEDPILGTLIQIEELSQLTGIPKPTIRLWRRDEYRHLAKFNHYTSTATRAAWYRLADVHEWLLTNGRDLAGNRSMFVLNEAPNAVSAPLNEAIDSKRHEAMTYARKITKLTQRKLRQSLIKDFDNPTMTWHNFLKKHIAELTDIWFATTGEDPKPFVNAYPGYDGNYPAPNSDPDFADRDRYDFIMTALVRLFDAELNGRELSVAEVATIPVI
jgi:hypothetical protein